MKRLVILALVLVGFIVTVALLATRDSHALIVLVGADLKAPNSISEQAEVSTMSYDSIVRNADLGRCDDLTGGDYSTCIDIAADADADLK